MVAAMSRLDGAITAIRKAIATATDLPLDSIAADDDLADDLCLVELERLSLSLIVEEVFGVVLCDELWTTPLYRTPAAMAEWVIRQAEVNAEVEARRQRKRA